MFDLIIALLILLLIAVLLGIAGFVTGVAEITYFCGIAFLFLLLVGVSTTVTAYRRHLPL